MESKLSEIFNGLAFHFLDVKIADSNVLVIKNRIIQRKFDGTAVEVFINDNIRLFGKGILEYGISSEYTRRFPEIVEALKKLGFPKQTDFVGELIVIDQKTGFENLDLVLIRSQRSEASEGSIRFYPAKLIILDVVSVGGEDVKSLKYFDRIKKLKDSRGSGSDWNKVGDTITFIESSIDLDWKYIEENKLEGVIIRDLDASYGKGIWKLKREVTEDVYCKGEYNKSESMIGLFASLICYQLDKDGKEVNIADVGGGFTDKERKDIQKILDSGIMKEYPLVLEIKTNGRTSSLKFKSPIFIRIRYDKPWNLCKIN